MTNKAVTIPHILSKDEVGISNLLSSSRNVLETQVSRTFSSFMGKNNQVHFCLTIDAPLLGKFSVVSRGLLEISPDQKKGRSLSFGLRPSHSFGGADFGHKVICWRNCH